MTGPTHRQFSISFAYLLVIIMYSLGMLSAGLSTNTPNYYIALIIALYTSKQGALFPDVDHEWEFVKEKTGVNLVINKLIHLTGGSHRSWQTHSIDICVIVTASCIVIPKWMNNKGIMSEVNMQFTYALALGFCAGWISHLVSDMMNGVGVRVLCWYKGTAALVPKKLFKLKFNTGEEWEAFCQLVVKGVNKFLFFVAILYPTLGFTWVQELFDKITSIIGGII